MSRLPVALLLLFALGLLCLPGARPALAQSGIHRCVNAAGEAIFTDKDCSDVQATERAAPAAPAAGATRVVAARSCARTREDLLFGVRSALEAQDVNRLAAYFLWTGMGTREAYALMERLDRFSAQPLVEAQLVYDASATDGGQADSPPAPPALAPSPPAPVPAEAPAASAGATAPAPRGPRLLRVDQMRSAGDITSETTYFHLVTAAGCWWIRF